MKTFAIILKIGVLSLVGIGLLSLFWVFVIPGMLLWVIFRDRYHRWIGSVVALAVVLFLRVTMGEWQMRIGGQSSGEWFSELMLGDIIVGSRSNSCRSRIQYSQIFPRWMEQDQANKTRNRTSRRWRRRGSRLIKSSFPPARHSYNVIRRKFSLCGLFVLHVTHERHGSQSKGRSEFEDGRGSGLPRTRAKHDRSDTNVSIPSTIAQRTAVQG